jgi:ABC-type sugar transport system ATPase subunit
MEEISKVADTVVVLRDGVIAGVDEMKNLDRDKIIRWMVGRDVSNIFPARERRKPSGEPLLSVKDLTLVHVPTGKKLVEKVSFELWAGETLGLGGLMGAGRSELALAVFGYFGRHSPRRAEFDATGEVRFAGRPLRWDAPAEALNDKVAMLTEDRKGSGLFLNRPAAENMTVTVLNRLSRGGPLRVLNGVEEHALIKKLSGELRVRGPGLHAEVGVYSGGNQQKVALAKCLAIEPRLLILDEPTRGVDIGAKLEIYEIMSSLSARGVGILLVTSELPELLGLSDRVAVLRQGAISAVFEGGELDPERIMHAASL